MKRMPLPRGATRRALLFSAALLAGPAANGAPRAPEPAHRCNLELIREASKRLADFKTQEGLAEDWSNVDSGYYDDMRRREKFAVDFGAYLGRNTGKADAADKGMVNTLCEHHVWNMAGSSCLHRLRGTYASGEYSAAYRYNLSSQEACLRDVAGLDEAFFALDKAAQAPAGAASEVLETAAALGAAKIEEVSPWGPVLVRKGLDPAAYERKATTVKLAVVPLDWHGTASNICPYEIGQLKPTTGAEGFKENWLALFSDEIGRKDRWLHGETVQAYYGKVLELGAAVLAFGRHPSVNRRFQSLEDIMAASDAEARMDSDHMTRVAEALAKTDNFWSIGAALEASRSRAYEKLLRNEATSPAALSSVDWPLRNQVAADYRQVYDLLHVLEGIVMCSCRDQDSFDRTRKCFRRLLAAIDRQIITERSKGKR